MLYNLIQFAATESAEGSEAAKSGAAVLGIDPLAIVLQATTFLILFVVIRKVALSKIVQNLADRRETIEEGLQNAELMERQREELEKESAQALTAARKEADDIIGRGHEEAGAIVSDAQARAVKQAEEIVAKAKAQAEAEAEKVRRELKGEMLGLIADATEIVLDEKMTDAKDKQLIENAMARGVNS